MNAGRLIDFVRTFVRADAPDADLPNTAQVLDLLNQAQFEASNELGLPVKYVQVTNEDAPFNLPADAQGTNPLIEVRYEYDGQTRVLPIYSVERAGLEFPEWQAGKSGEPEFVIDGAGVVGLSDVYVYPDPGVSDWFITYKVQPSDLVDFADVPFDGELDRFHIMLAHYVTFMLTNNDQRFAIYRDMMSRAGGVRHRGPKMALNAAYDMKGSWYR